MHDCIFEHRVCFRWDQLAVMRDELVPAYMQDEFWLMEDVRQTERDYLLSNCRRPSIFIDR
jgi:hypothetical protein